MFLETLTIVPLLHDPGDCGVYTNDPGHKGPFGTALLFRGTEEECIDFIVGDRKVIHPIEDRPDFCQELRDLGAGEGA